MAALYSYIGLSGETVTIADTNINFRGAWSVSTSYAVKDSVTYNSRRFIAITAHTGVTPPSTFVIETPTYWSPLVLVEGDPEVDDTNSELVAQAAYDQAQYAVQTAWAGTNVANDALALAAAGTDAAADAQAAADAAYSLATNALNTAWTGTGAQGAADAAYSLAQQALETAWVGTNQPNYGVLKHWSGRVTQDDLNDPESFVFHNSYVNDIIWTRQGVGIYHGVIADSEFTLNHTFCQVSPQFDITYGTACVPATTFLDEGTLVVAALRLQNGNPPIRLADDRLDVFLEIKTYNNPQT